MENSKLFLKIGNPIRTMPVELIRLMIKDDILNPSPYNGFMSGSWYNNNLKSWDFTAPGTIRVSDHWNFASEGRVHCVTHQPIESGGWYVGNYDGDSGIYNIIKSFPKKELRKKDNTPSKSLKTRVYDIKMKEWDNYENNRLKKREDLSELFLSEGVVKKTRLCFSLTEKMKKIINSIPKSGYTMGDLVVLKCGEVSVTLDTREYYQGRGKRYNENIRHGNISETMTKTKINKIFKEKYENNEKFLKIKSGKKYLSAIKKFDKLIPYIHPPSWRYDYDYNDDYDYDCNY